MPRRPDNLDKSRAWAGATYQVSRQFINLFSRRIFFHMGMTVVSLWRLYTKFGYNWRSGL